ncbi:MAG: septum formation initiator family protein [Nitrospirota bacterium]|jgi:cell division protein FtsB
MYSSGSLRKQVSTEVRLRRYAGYTFLFLSLLYVLVNLLLSDMGLVRYLELRGKRAALEEEVTKVEAHNGTLQASIENLKKDDFYVEKNARENFGLADPEEFIFIYK